MPPQSSVLRWVRALAYCALTLPLMPVQAVLLLLRSPLADRLPLAYHRLVCHILGIMIERRGDVSPTRPTLFVANHTSYLDIEVLGASIPGSFVSKADVDGWPLFGRLARLQRTVFIDRKRRSVAHQRDALSARLRAGDRLILFPEGTSGDGQRLLPFKSALFAAVMEAASGGDITVQPVSVAYLTLDGMPLGRSYRPFFAWYGDMALAPHLWTMLGLGRLGVSVTFHPAVNAAGFASRKALAEHCAAAIAAGLSAALAGREGMAQRPVSPPSAPEALAFADAVEGA
ncbi:MAG: 1-acyl-sn-glycerol-3-phosphate acyltransferase [Alphaproteobacteria bacterium]|nr:1-acyl-sn-glycerol-3-phosphate acyltransferase [Alphaproteobacteria bacterium]